MNSLTDQLLHASAQVRRLRADGDSDKLLYWYKRRDTRRRPTRMTGDDMLLTIAYIALIIGIVLVIAGYTVEARALRPGFGCLIVALVLILVAYLVPAVHGAPVALGLPTIFG